MFSFFNARDSRSSILPTQGIGLERQRKMTYPLANSSRSKHRRWPLVMRFHKGAIHGAILIPILVHALITALVVYVCQEYDYEFNIPNSIIPSLSIVMGLMLVFRNQTAYSRFWNGRLHLNTITTSLRCLARQILVLAPPPPPPRRHSYPSKLGDETPLLRRSYTRSVPNITEMKDSERKTQEEEGGEKVVETVKVLIAMLYTIKNHLRADWGVALSPGMCISDDGQVSGDMEYKDLLPKGLRGYEHQGLALTLELSVFVESLIAMGSKRGWFHNGAVSQMLAQLDKLIHAYGHMEVIRLTPVPVAHLVHHQQTLAVFCIFLSLATATEMGWWAVPLLAFITFTLYGIEGIAQTYEDPFDAHRIGIRMNDIVKDARREIEVLLSVWQNQNDRRAHDHGCEGCHMFVPPHREESSSSESSNEVQDWSLNVGKRGETFKGVRWADEQDFSDRNHAGRSQGSMSPVYDVFRDHVAGGISLGARRVTWGSSVGDADAGVFEAPAFLMTTSTV